MKHTQLPLTLIACLLLGFASINPLSAQDKSEWELPIKNDLICFEYSKEFNNKKKELASYVASQNPNFQGELNSKIGSVLSGKGKKWTSTTTYGMNAYMVFTTFLTPNHVKGLGEPNKDDTLDGKIIITIVKQSMKLAGSKQSFNTIEAKIRMICIGTNQYKLKIRGFVLKSDKPSIKGNVATEDFLEDSYNSFVKDEKKSKSDIAFYKDLNELISIFQTQLDEQLIRGIRVDELD